MSEVDKEVKHHFDEVSRQYYNVVDATPFLYGYYHAKELSSIRTFLTSFLSKIDSTKVGNLRILDIGCATGRIIEHLQGAAPASLFVGVDLSREMIRLAKKIRRSRTEFVVGDIRNLPFRDVAFDFVYTLEVLEHLGRKLQAIPNAVSEVMRVTRTGGFTTFESTSFWHFRLQEILQRSLPGVHVSLLQQENLAQYSKAYRSAPLTVAEPSHFRFVSGLITLRGGKIETTSWVRVIPEQIFVVMNNNLIRGLLARADELLARLPGLRRLGREFIICSVKLSS